MNCRTQAGNGLAWARATGLLDLHVHRPDIGLQSSHRDPNNGFAWRDRQFPNGEG